MQQRKVKSIGSVLLSLTLIIFLTSCSSVKKIETFFTPVEREPLNLKEPVLGKLESIKWIVITSENAEEVFKKLEEEGIDPVLFGLTDNDYQLIAKNFAQIRHNLKTKSEIIKSYKDYYELNKVKPKGE
tara:strand:+ start:111 stop:497 length:387 start_codon:yes stop_codon:yes gene_type:complete